MKAIHAYLSFNGNCRQAMKFYQHCLGGKLVFQTVGETPLSDKLPVGMKKAILHATLSNGRLLLMGTDLGAMEALQRGNAVTLLLNCISKKDISECYRRLSQGGEQTHPLEQTYWGAIFGGLTDKYNNNWLLNYQTKTP